MLHKQLEIPGQGAHLAPFLVGSSVRWAIPGDCALVDHDALALADHVHWNQHIIEDGGIGNWLPKPATHGIQRTTDTDHGGERGFLLANEFLVAPIGINAFAEIADFVAAK